MLQTINNIITVKRWDEVSWESSYIDLITGLSCYIEPADFEVASNVDGESTSDVFNLFSDNTNIIIWDKIIDKDWNDYKVKWTKVFDDLLGTHIEAVILKTYWEDA